MVWEKRSIVHVFFSRAHDGPSNFFKAHCLISISDRVPAEQGPAKRQRRLEREDLSIEARHSRKGERLRKCEL